MGRYKTKRIMNKIVKQILTIEPCVISNEDIEELYRVNNFREAVFKMIPKWVINPDYGNVILAEYFLQFTGTLKQENVSYYYVFDIYSADPYIQNEINEDGVEWIFKESCEDWRNVLPREVPSYKEFKKTWINEVVRLLFNLEYSTTYYEGIPEGDLEISFDKILEI